MQDPYSERMSASETRAASGLALVFAFRMLGMFMVLPVLATYGTELQGATPALIGLAIGAYGLTQAVLQIPFGILSDRIGRLPVIYFGLLIFAAGAALAATADSIWGVIAGRILQGAGAISAAVMALLSDLTREQHRTKAMALIGMSIGVSFAVAMVVGPLMTRAFGLSGLFWATAIMALAGIGVVVTLPRAHQHLRHRESGVAGQALWPTLRHPDLLRLDFSILALHAILMASFVALPLALVTEAGLPRDEHWWVYLSALVTGFFGMVPFIIYGEKKRQMRRVVLGAVGALLLTELFFLALGDRLWSLVAGMILFFTAFNLLEASLPSLISKVAPAGGKGTAMGVYSTSQFLGAGAGGILGGWMYQIGGLELVFGGCAVLCALWLLVTWRMREPPYVTGLRLPLSAQAVDNPRLAEQMLAVQGVSDALVITEEAAAYLKVDMQLLDRAALDGLVA
ncbi:MFS transporter [Stutzerimonas chloritidismutans]|uniref:MFS transporter n=1 Tax=Stutzerimonas chloritidismutans TaxID=203192 RepID=UPI003F1778E2